MKAGNKEMEQLERYRMIAKVALKLLKDKPESELLKDKLLENMREERTLLESIIENKDKELKRLELEIQSLRKTAFIQGILN